MENELSSGWDAGFREWAVPDAELGISVPVMLFYPCVGESKAIRKGPFELEVVPDGDMAPGAWPLLVISHGSGGTALTHRNLGLYFARQGFVVALPTHPCDHRFDQDWSNRLENFIHRPRHLSLLLDHLYETLGDNLSGAVHLLGHSMGGYACLAAAGGKPSLASLGEWCRSAEGKGQALCEQLSSFSGEIEPGKHPEVLSVVLVDADVRIFEGADALAGVSANLVAYLAERGGIPTSASRAVLSHLPGKAAAVIQVPGATHYSFLSPFPPALKAHSGMAGNDPPGFDREEFHRKWYRELRDFFVNS